MSAARDKINQQILDLLAGMPTVEAFEIQANILAATVGGVSQMGGMPQDVAFGLIDTVAAYAKAQIERNWGAFVSVDEGGS